jgi:tetratricopeptide (TPR) repeat protein
VILGTIGYLSPEQASGGTVEPSSDLFSLGCVLHESLYGERPFGGETIPESLAAIINSQPQVDPQRAAADRQLSETIARCLEKEPQRRFASAAELAQQLARPDQASAAVPLEHAGKPGTALSRRGWIAGAAGVTAVAAGVVLAGNVRRWFALPPRIESVAVLPLNSPDVSPAGTEPTATQDEGGGSLRTRHLHKGEELSAAIADQMTRIADLQVYPFLPLRQHDLAGAPGALGAPGGSPPSAEPAARSERTPDDYRQLANELGVDALLVGSVSTDAEGFDTVSVQLLSARGFQIGRYRVRKAAAENLIGQRDLAQQIAEEIGREIDAYHSGDQRSNESYHCLVNGYARMDPDSIAALSDALACYRSAVRQDQKFPEAYAGIALTSMILLEQADAERRSDLVEAARDAIERVEALGSDLPSAELAAAMLAWQVDLEMGRAERLFAQCMPRMRQSWVANYEYGVFLAAQGRWIEAMDRFRTAQRIDPMSVSFKLEAARTMWLRGEPQRALAQIDAVKAAFTGTAREAAIGLELDILEDTRRMQQARRLLAATLDREIADRDYWDVRAGSLQRLPYGPYGDQLNAAIVQLRRAAQAPGPASEQEPFLLRLRAAQGARLSYLTSIHPAFAMVRQLSSMRDLIVRPSLPM